MREENIAGLDLNLLPALEALLRRRSVTQAAADVGLSQPAMSRALARLRDLHGDPLLVRTAHGYGLTPRAVAIQAQLAPAMRLLRDVFHPPSFDPATARRTIRLAAADVQTVLLVPPLMARLAREAPGLDLRIEPYGPDLMVRLESGALDFSFALATTPLPPGIGADPIGRDRLVLVMRRDHPAANQSWTMADYGRWEHAGVSIFGDGQTELDARLAARRRVAPPRARHAAFHGRLGRSGRDRSRDHALGRTGKPVRRCFRPRAARRALHRDRARSVPRVLALARHRSVPRVVPGRGAGSRRNLCGLILVGRN